MPFGASLAPEGGVQFGLWAPAAEQVELVLGLHPGERTVAMPAVGDGWRALHVLDAAAGTRYAFRIDGSLQVPDPASRYNPDDVHGASAVVDARDFDWPDDGWTGRPWHEAVIYELHVGAFTPAGTYAAAMERLPELAKLGVTAIELMPLADFPGARSWGYDGVLLYAPDASYGTPDDLKRFVAAAHAAGLMVLLDVVYNHFGPDGNYLHAYAPQFFNAQHQTPWGAAINFDAPGSRTVRDFYIHNALYWLEEFHFDGLRLDAVHAIADDSEPHFVAELARAVHEGPGRERRIHLVLENERNQARFLERDARGTPALATSQWNDDAHNAAHALVTGESDGYYAAYAREPLRLYARALAEGFAFQGEASAHHDGAARGEPCVHLPPLAFVNFLQNHDQVGNRAFGERLTQLAPPAAVQAFAACLLLAPAPPLLFMGEEYAASTPFLYFCDFKGDLALAVTQGRRAEFSRFAHFHDPQLRERIPNPNAAATFAASKLDWDEQLRPDHSEWLAHYRLLLTLRREQLMPLLPLIGSGSYEVEAPGLLAVRWPIAPRGRLHLLANLAPTPAAAAPLPGKLLYESQAIEGTTLPPWSVRVALELP